MTFMREKSRNMISHFVYIFIYFLYLFIFHQFFCSFTETVNKFTTIQAHTYKKELQTICKFLVFPTLLCESPRKSWIAIKTNSVLIKHHFDGFILLLLDNLQRRSFITHKHKFPLKFVAKTDGFSCPFFLVRIQNNKELDLPSQTDLCTLLHDD